MANLVVCCDGTWSTPDNDLGGEVAAPTNVYKLFCAVDISNDTEPQLTRYQAGVGTGGLIDRALGGAVGYGLGEDIRDCYQWLATKYTPGDNIYLFGFSRGAYTARSLAGLIGRFGIVRLGEDENWDNLVGRVYRDGYRKGKSASELRAEFYPDSKQIKFVGVWDTVGALGVPDDKALLNFFDNPKNYSFHDTKLGSHIEVARHAVAIDEKRGSFSPTLWDTEGEHRDVKQLWFPGVHCDVGGGYQETGLSDGALKWMIDEAKATGLSFYRHLVDQVKPNPQDVKHESHVGVMKALVSVPRSIPDVLGNEHQFHESVMLRREYPPISQGAYLPVRNIAEGPVRIDIYAKQPWNWTGIYLEAGKKYRFKAEGQWMDASIPAGPSGVSDDKFHIGEIALLAGTGAGWLETRWKKLFDNEQVDFFGTKRIEHSDWFTLMGAVADGGNPKPDGSHDKVTHFEIGDGCEFECEKSGYLYCFANDAWGFYYNNRGFVTLEVEEV